MAASTFDGKVALITGGASGIGAALARSLASQGAEVVVADRQAAVAEEVADGIRRANGRAHAAELDVRQLASFERVVADTLQRSRRIDLLFNNAGIGVGGEMDTYEARDWDDVFDVNLRGVAYGVQCVYPVMIRQGSGHIVNTASMAGLVVAPANGSYTATKYAVVGLSKALRIEARRHGVRVSVLCPGAIATPILTGGVYGRMNVSGLSKEKLLKMWGRFRPLDADEMARRTLRAVARDEAIIIVPGWWKALWLLERASPSLSSRFWSKALDMMRSELRGVGATAPVRVGEGGAKSVVENDSSVRQAHEADADKALHG